MIDEIRQIEVFEKQIRKLIAWRFFLIGVSVGIVVTDTIFRFT